MVPAFGGGASSNIDRGHDALRNCAYRLRRSEKVSSLRHLANLALVPRRRPALVSPRQERRCLAAEELWSGTGPRYQRGMHRGITFAIALALAACSKAEPPKITPEAVRVVKISPAGAELEATLDAWNPNGETLTASQLTTNVSIGGKPDVARAHATKPLELAANQRVRVTIPIAVEWVNQAALAELAASKQEAQYSVEGAVEMNTKSGKVSAPFRVEGRMTPAELAQASGAAPAPSAAPTATTSASAPAASASASAAPKK